MGRIFKHFLDTTETARIYSCSTCKTHLALRASVESSGYVGQSGPAMLIKHIVNTIPGITEKRKMMTGVYEVTDMKCVDCGTVVGWRYVSGDRPQAGREVYITI